MQNSKKLALVAGLFILPQMALAHGDVTPQPVDIGKLPTVGEEWLEENPYRTDEMDIWLEAVRVGSSGYTQNCARCHGLGAVSGGLAPDLRYLESDSDGDEWFMERYRHGYTQNGITKMPAFGEVLGQEAGWAIKIYVESRPEDGAFDEYNDQLVAMRDRLDEIQTAISGGEAAESFADEVSGFETDLDTIANEVETANGEGKANSIAFQASLKLHGEDPERFRHAAEILTVGLSAAQ